MIIYAVVIIFNTVNVSRLKLIDLIYAGRKSEKLRMKNPWLCTLVFVAAAAVLANCYYRVGFHAVDISLKGMSWVIVAGMICTFLIFWSVSGLLASCCDVHEKLILQRTQQLCAAAVK